jgi:FdhD protein
MREFEIAPNPEDPALSVPVSGRDHLGAAVEVHVVAERPLTVFLNRQEIVTLMTIGDHPDLLAAGYLLNQGMLRSGSDIAGIEHDPELETVVVRTFTPTNFEEKLKKKVRTSGCAQGTRFRRPHGGDRRRACVNRRG